MLSLDLVDKGLVTDQLVVTVGYDIENLTDPERRAKYHGTVVKDHYGRQIPKHSHGTINLDGHTSSTRKIMCAAGELFDRIVDRNLLIRRLNVVANHVLPKDSAPTKNDGFEQLDLFTDYAAAEGTARPGTTGVGTRTENAESHANYQEEIRQECNPPWDELGRRRNGQRPK